jgi:nucleotide-binding universal stress UspA family protein
VLVAVQGNVVLLGELYAFGLLGAFTLKSVGVDVLRWRDSDRGATFWLGAATTVAVMVAFSVNLVAKPLATGLGGTIAGIGMLLGLGTRTGTLDRLLQALPGFAPPRQIERAEVPFLTIAQAREQRRDGPPGILVASRGATRKIFKEAVDRARSRGSDTLYLMYVDEVPGLFYPQLASPTPEGLTVLEAGSAIIESLGMKPVPVWALSHGAAESVAEAAEETGCDTVVIGATQRTVLWHALRGKFIQDLLGQLPADIRLIVVG